MRLDIFKPKSPPLLGMDISSSAVKMVELADAGKGARRVERYAIEPLPKDAVLDGNIANLDAVAEAVRRGWKKLATRTKNVALALPTAAVITKKIIVPAGLREEELEVQVEGEANQYIPFALDEVSLDFQVMGPIPNAPDDVEVLIAASRKEKVEDREGRDQNIAVVDVGASVMNITVLRNEQALYTREQPFGGNQLNQEIMRHYGLSPEEAESAKRSGGLPDSYEAEVLRPFLENAAAEIQRAAQFFFTSTQYNSLEHIVLTGGCATLPGLDDMVASRTRVNTVVANPFASMSISPRIQLKKLIADAPALMVACGLAMRRFDA